MLSKEEFEKTVQEVFRFHTKKAPGIVIAVAMVDYAREELGPVKSVLYAVSETQLCLSDAIQVMTGCTTGNRYLRVAGTLGRYALTLFDRASGQGVRVFVDVKKIDPTQTPELARFFSRTRPPETQQPGPAREESGKKVVEEFHRVGRGILSMQRVQVKNHGKPPMLPAKTCSQCGESFLARDEKVSVCDFCNGTDAYFEVVDPR